MKEQEIDRANKQVELLEERLVEIQNSVKGRIPGNVYSRLLYCVFALRVVSLLEEVEF